jgi:hypothetical protein
MRTPRGFTTLIGNGWLREPPRASPMNEPRSRSALRKCMFMQVPPELRALAPVVSPAALPPPPKKQEEQYVYRRGDPAKDARMFPAYPMKKPAAAAPAQKQHEARAWWEDPVAIGSLLILLPPVGLAAVWRSKHYTTDARWALTVMTALTMCLVSAITIAILALR